MRITTTHPSPTTTEVTVSSRNLGTPRQAGDDLQRVYDESAPHAERMAEDEIIRAIEKRLGR